MNSMASKRITKDVVEKFGFNFTKSLGQNFLVDEHVLEKIVDGSLVEEGDYVMEIGPGIGTLTRELGKRAKKVITIEIDRKLIPILEDTLSDMENIKVVNQDILKVDLFELLKEEFERKPFKVVANLPYYITTPIIMKFLEEGHPMELMVIMIQKEVAHRMAAKPGGKEYGALSVAVQYYCEVDIVANAPKGAFMPPPNVDSTVIRLKRRTSIPWELKDRDLFFKTVKAGFSKRRKTLLNALSSSDLNISKEGVKEILEIVEIQESRRAETLDMSEFAKLANGVYDYLNR